MRIDAHQHFWKYNPLRDSWIDESMKTIQKDFYPEDLKPILELHRFSGSVAIQADPSEQETLFLCDLAKKNDCIKAVVGWIDFNAHDIEFRLNALQSQSKLVGFREILQAKNPSVLYSPNFRKGIATLNKKGYTYDVLIYPEHLPATLDLVKSFPSQKFVIDHLAKPKIKSAEWKNWANDMKKVGAHENVYCKLSGMVTEADWKYWKPLDFQPYFDSVLEIFGPKRIMYGSDWPVCLLAAEYSEQLSLVEQLISSLNNTEQAQIMGETACQFYGIS